MDIDQQIIDAMLEEVGNDSVPLSELVARLCLRQDLVTVLDGVSPDELASAIRDDVEATSQFWFTDDEVVVAIETMLDGIRLSHWVTSVELKNQVLTVYPDLAILDCDMIDSISLHGGGELEFVASSDIELDDGEEVEPTFFYRGREGWLDGIDEPSLVILSRRDGVAFIQPGEIVGDGADEAQAIRQVFDEGCSAPEDALDVVGVLLEVLARNPSLFRSPVPPITDLCEIAGLVVDGALLYLAAEDLADDESTMESVGRQFGFGPCCDTAFTEVLSYVLSTVRQDAQDVDEEEVGKRVIRNLAHENVAPALANSILEDCDERNELLDAVLARLNSAGLASAQTHYLAALNLERACQPVEAERELTIATTLDPQFRPALEELAWYVSDAGDLRRADGLYARAGVEVDDLRRSYLQDLLVRPFQGVGRNDPCPCGSGRKYKVCCFKDGSLAIERRIGLLYQKLLTFALRPQNRHLFYSVFEAAHGYDDADLGERTLPLLLDIVCSTPEMLEKFIRARGVLLPADELELVGRWIGVGPSLWQVTEVDPGSSLTMLDTIGGDSRLVTERSMSQEVGEGDYIYCHVVPAGSSFQIVGMPLLVTTSHRESLVAALAAGEEPRELASWVGSVFRPIQMRTTDDEEIVICRSELTPRTTTWEEIEGVLDHMFRRDAEGKWTATGYNDLIGSVARGWLERDDDTLVVTTTSVEREEDLLGMLMDAFDDLEIIGSTQTEFAEAQKLAERGRPTPAASPNMDPDQRGSSIEAQAALAQFMREREDAWLDESIPALHGLTPRQAANDPSRREELVALLNEFDRYPKPAAGGASFDVSRLRDLLGIENDG